MEVSEAIILLIFINILAVFRFIIFSKFNKQKVIIGLAAINLALFFGYFLFKDNDITFSDTDITIFILLGIIALFAVFYLLEKRK